MMSINLANFHAIENIIKIIESVNGGEDSMKKIMKFLCASIALGLIATSATAQGTSRGTTLQNVKKRGVLNCPGHNVSYLGFAEVDDRGEWKGLDIELCRAMATAIFNDPTRVNIIPMSWVQRWPALQGGEVDIMIKLSAATLQRDSDLGFQFTMPYYLGTTKALAHAALGITSIKEADGGTLCVPAGTAQEKYAANYIETLGITVQTIAMENTEELEQVYFQGRCDFYVHFEPSLATAIAQAENPNNHVYLNDILEVSPEVMIVRENDDSWLDIANWLITILIKAEQEGITAANVAQIRANPPGPDIAKMLGVTPGMGSPLGLQDDWAYQVIAHHGNYGEIFERNLGSQSPYKIPRGLNALWKDGGVLYPFVID